MTFADKDKYRVNGRTLENRRLKDIAFLDELRTASLDRLRELEANHANKSAPQWKKIAIERAIARKELTS